MEEEYLGMVKLFAGNFAPKNWAFCDGSMLYIANCPNLYSVLGNKYGGDGRITFAVPDLRETVPMGLGYGMEGRFDIKLGEQYGEATLQLTADQLAAHTHYFAATGEKAYLNEAVEGGLLGKPGDDSSGSFQATLGFNKQQADTPLHENTILPIGQSQAHNNMQPFLAMNYIICINGVYPERN